MASTAAAATLSAAQPYFLGNPMARPGIELFRQAGYRESYQSFRQQTPMVRISRSGMPITSKTSVQARPVPISQQSVTLRPEHEPRRRVSLPIPQPRVRRTSAPSSAVADTILLFYRSTTEKKPEPAASDAQLRQDLGRPRRRFSDQVPPSPPLRTSETCA